MTIWLRDSLKLKHDCKSADTETKESANTVLTILVPLQCVNGEMYWKNLESSNKFRDFVARFTPITTAHGCPVLTHLPVETRLIQHDSLLNTTLPI
jgi:hypothetical protein